MTNQSRKVNHPGRGSDRSHNKGGVSAGFRDAIDIEDAARAVNRINSRIKREGYEAKLARSAKVTLGGGDALTAWLRKDVP